jgi:hypothetical protein
VSWVATYSAEFYSHTPCTDAAGRFVPNRLEGPTTLRGRTGDATSSYPNSTTFRENANLVIQWDPRQSRWIVRFNGTRPRRFVEKLTHDCGKTWRSQTGIGGGLTGFTIHVDGTSASRALKGQGKPDSVAETDTATATWGFTLAPSR